MNGGTRAGSDGKEKEVGLGCLGEKEKRGRKEMGQPREEKRRKK